MDTGMGKLIQRLLTAAGMFECCLSFIAVSSKGGMRWHYYFSIQYSEFPLSFNSYFINFVNFPFTAL